VQKTKRVRSRHLMYPGKFEASPFDERCFIGCINYNGSYKISPEAGDVSGIMEDDHSEGWHLNVVGTGKIGRKKRKFSS